MTMPEHDLHHHHRHRHARPQDETVSAARAAMATIARNDPSSTPRPRSPAGSAASGPIVPSTAHRTGFMRNPMLPLLPRVNVAV